MKVSYVIAIGLLLAVVLVAGCTGSQNVPTSTPASSGTGNNNPTAVAAPTQAPQAAAVGLSKSNPAPLGTSVTFKDTFNGSTYTVNMTLEKVLRGADAWNLLNSAKYNLNSEPKSGKEYMLAKFKVEVSGGDPNTAYVMSSMLEFHVVSNGVPEDFALVYIPDSEKTLPEELYPGGSTEGWRGFVISSDDSSPLIEYGLSGIGQTVWFKTA